mmetsp:Transcript_26874/g.104301  ORF Transcript_26874/g.104301 Transcript_26874/m.104301 type:complete len:219 (-) Transcript_26874:2223-2879(-)
MKARKRRGGMTSVAKVYRDVNVERSPVFWDYEKIDIKWGGQDQYDAVQKVGRGKYSDVFEAVNCLNRKKCIIKVLKPVKPRKIRREISILTTLFGGPNVVKLLDVCLDPDSKVPSLIFEHVNNYDHKQLFSSFTIDDVRFYIKEVRVAHITDKVAVIVSGSCGSCLWRSIEYPLFVSAESKLSSLYELLTTRTPMASSTETSNQAISCSTCPSESCEL